MKKRISTGLTFFLFCCLVVAVLIGLKGVAPGETSGDISKESIDLLTRTGRAMAEVTASVKPAIVNISVSRAVKAPESDSPHLNDPFFKRFFGDRFGPQGSPRQRKSAGLASGVIVSSDGYIITNFHVVKGADDITVLLSDRREFKGSVVGSDPKTEISIIKIDATELPTISWGDSDSLEVGEVVLALGNPYGLNHTVTMGIVSALGRANVGIADYEDFIQTDAAINPGNSGGALVNVQGEVVGINTAIYSTTGGYQGIGFAIPSNMVRSIMDSLIKTGKVIRGWLGVSIQKLTPDLARQFGSEEIAGALVGEVVEGSPAAKAGIERGDIITAYDGRKVDEPFVLRNMVASTAPGEEHELTVRRNGGTRTLKVVIGEFPSDDGQVTAGGYVNVLKGVSVQELTTDIAGQLEVPSRIKGVVVTDVAEDSAAVGKLSKGDIIQEINREKISSTRDYQEVVSKIQQKDDVLLLIYRRGSSLFIGISAR